MDDRNFEREWLETNGMGGYASSTIAGCHTRKYHGLLVSNLSNPKGKYVLLSKLDDAMVLANRELPLTAHRYVGGMVPDGEVPLGFEHKGRPVFRYRYGNVTVTKEIVMVQGEDTVLVKYGCTQNRPGARLTIKPLIAYRDFHALTGENLFLRVRTFPIESGFVMSPYDGMPPLHMQLSGSFQFYPSPTWYRQFYYTNEQARGFDAAEDLFCPGVFELQLSQGESVVLGASTSPQSDLIGLWKAETDSRKRARSGRGSALQKSLRHAARQFVERGPSGDAAIIAGFPWFLAWGRDAMIALPGLLLGQGDDATYLQVLERFATQQRGGIIPNFLGHTPADNAYNSADAALWFAWAVQQYLVAHPRSAREIPAVVTSALAQTLRCYMNGTDHGIHMLPNGLLSVGSPAEQVTWMDANANGVPVTPRSGCPVEINALWYNFICFLASRGDRLGLRVEVDLPKLAALARESFNQRFWLSDPGYLADVVDGDTVDRTLRPNQIFAVSLDFSPLDRSRAKSVVAVVQSELLTPVGLRTLARSDPRYCPRYEGGPAKRDSAYHNGTVWPWLIGHFGEALLNVSDDPAGAIETLEGCLSALEAHLDDAGVGSISEIFDAEVPHTPRGCISQAWSVAETLRLVDLVKNAKQTLSKERAQCAS